MTDDESADIWCRALRQQLEGWQRAGVTHVPRLEPRAASAPAPSVAVSAPGVAERQQPIAPAVADTSTVENQNPESMPRTPRQAARTAAPPLEPVPAPVQPKAKGDDSAAGRQARLDVVKTQVAACTRCAELACTRKQTVFGVGNPQARVVFLGEAPGADEDRQGEPFVGRAGQLLNKIITAMTLRREDIYICNILRCRPPENRTPLPAEAANCREWLDAQLEIIDPDYIVCWGTCAAQNLLGVTDTIGRMRGRFYQHGRARVLCTYHPSYLLRNPEAKKPVWDDMQLLMGELGIEVDKG